MMSEKKANLRWGQHPLISTVLWMLGTDGVETPDSQASNSTNKSNNVGWKDQHGGNMVEYMSQIQQVESKQRRPEAEPNGTQLYPRSFYAKEQGPEPHDESQQSVVHADISEGKEMSPAELVDESPQWGFYVPITPPQQEVYAALSKEVTSSVQADQRRAKR